MLYRSTGLGKSELVAEIVTVRRQGDYLVMEMQTTEPVRWKIRGALSREDFKGLFKALLRLSVLAFFFNLVGWFRKPQHPGEF
jgi:hypothetical protein